ncbi:MAG: hypothetical protein LZ173_08135 [Thaumarchaeota archaeon]|nr:hypothetical protein [Candidatus Geocrenenecus arthurdayi]
MESKTIKTAYVDTSVTATNGKRKRKLHTVFDGEETFKVSRLTKLKNINEVFIDTLFPENYNEILELLKRDVKVYTLKDTRMLKKLRKENNLKKSDEIDSQLLSKIPKEYFRAFTIQEIERKVKLQPLINKYELLSKRIKTLKMWIKRDGYDYRLRDSLRLMEEDKEEIAKKIIEIFSDDAVYMEACRMLGISGSVDLAILLNGLRLETPSAAIRGYLGLTNNRNGRYNRSMRGHLAQLANVIYVDVKRGVVEPSCKELTDIIAAGEPKNKTLFKLQAKILKTLKDVWRTMSYQVDDKPAGR